MSDDMDMSMDFDGDFDIDFGSVKELPQVREGDYLMTIVDWEISKPKSEESAKKGRNLKVKFQFADPNYEDDNGNVHDISVIKPNVLIYFMPKNPFAITSLLKAIQKVDDPKEIKVSGEQMMDKSEWIGEQVVARLVREEGNDGKMYLKPQPNAFQPAPF